MGVPAERQAIYDDLYTIPDNMIGEIINGKLYAMPRPSIKHANVATVLSIKIDGPFRLGAGGPGGWIFLVEPELKLGENILVPDIAGWKKERFPKKLETNWCEVPPDWICEVLSPSTVKIDKTKKMSIYAEYEVLYIWLVEPIMKSLDIFKLVSKVWMLSGSFTGDDKVQAEPFQEITIEMSDLWLE